MSREKNEGIQVQEYLYDVVEDGGAVSVIDLGSLSGGDLPIGARVIQCHAEVLTAFVGGGASLQWGNATDTDGYHVAVAVASLTINAEFHGGDGANALLFDDVGKRFKVNRVAVANDGKCQVEVTGGTLTAGKMRIEVSYLLGGKSDR